MRTNLAEQITTLSDELDRVTKVVAGNEGKIDVLSRQVLDSERRLEKLSADEELFTKAVELVLLAQQTLKQTVKTSFEQTITFALQHILGPDYRFEVAFNKHGNNQDTDFNVASPTLSEPFDPLDVAAGGVIDVVGMALRVALLEWYLPKVAGPLLLDETFKHLSYQYRPLAADFLKVVSEKYNRQVIMITHQQEFVDGADNRILIS